MEWRLVGLHVFFLFLYAVMALRVAAGVNKRTDILLLSALCFSQRTADH